MKNALIKNILNITLEEAYKLNEELQISFIIKDGKLKGFVKENKNLNEGVAA